jgi:hypothetical protein
MRGFVGHLFTLAPLSHHFPITLLLFCLQNEKVKKMLIKIVRQCNEKSEQVAKRELSPQRKLLKVQWTNKLLNLLG